MYVYDQGVPGWENLYSVIQWMGVIASKSSVSCASPGHCVYACLL